MLERLVRNEMKMYCECRVSGEYGLNIVLSFLEGYGFSAGGQFAFKIMSDDGELGAILENKDEVIREIINNNHINIIIINNDFDSLFFQLIK
ncbi:hypothetical protein AA0311_1617 [Asaia bogorensis NBRC 16594]|uniref:Uncharacterized protein n=1 Tax=Asaia bogorensis NBRC 16594 TaxID=1231624 RepID=A0AAN4R6R7_9PROT|nr:hypothetical protein AA0311_1617 [Asaia bogorensis NBRC 16594]GEL54466.1 hypothetical protein ABO01nite_24730 [Asaia bogorensis NBRC 16594]